ncbi:MAG TPA: VOC family protein, partial [Gemmatimonadales bacterium]|nr:VOC family protein [Gemmatimonadales bacterium]
LGEGGEEWPCGWLKDRFGVTWQITPAILPTLITQEDAAAAQRTMAEMMTMTKLDIARLQAASAGVPSGR